MNSLFLFAAALFSAFSPGNLSETLENISHRFVYDARIPYMLSAFHADFSRTQTYFSHRVILMTKDWKKNRDKDITSLFDGSPVELNIWLYGEEEANFRNANRIFEREFPQVTLRFQSFSQPQEYRQALEKAFSRGRIPDIIMMSNNWWPTYRRILSPFPKDLFSQEECHDFFFAFACDAFSTRTRIYAMPLLIETPLLIANRKMLTDDRITSGDKPADNWPAFLQNGSNFNRFFSGNGSFSALESGTQYDHSADIFRTLMLQVFTKEGVLIQASLTDVLNSVMKTIDTYGLYKEQRRLNTRQKSLFDRFLDGDIAVLFGNRAEYFALKNAFFERENINISESDIEIFPLPKISKTDDAVYTSSAWALAVPLNAKFSREAFGYIAYLSNEIPMKLFAEDSNTTSARRALAYPKIFRDIGDASKNPLGTSGTVAFETIFQKNILKFFTGEQSAIETAKILLPYFSK